MYATAHIQFCCGMKGNPNRGVLFGHANTASATQAAGGIGAENGEAGKLKNSETKEEFSRWDSSGDDDSGRSIDSAEVQRIAGGVGFFADVTQGNFPAVFW